MTSNPTEINLDATDGKILLYITKGYGSSYSVWSAMKKDAREGKLVDRKVMTYRNTNKRVIKLIKLGLIENRKSDAHTVNIHGRKDYEVTMKGMEHLISYLLSQSEDFEPISKYIYKSGLDRKACENILNHRILNILISGNSYYEVAGQMTIFPSKYITNIRIEDTKESKPVTMTTAAVDNESKRKKKR